jgi:hypothetical protein
MTLSLLQFNRYCYDDQVKEDKMGNACRAYGKMRNAYKILVVDFG